MTVRVLLAPDKFKASLTAEEVANHLAAGIASRRPDVELDIVPVADGGEGLLDTCISIGYQRVPATATGADGESVNTSWARLGGRAVVELAAIAGLSRLGRRQVPMTATSRGLGEVIGAAIDAGCREVVFGIGGSASTDGGLGMLQALGARATGAADLDVLGGGGSLHTVEGLELAHLRSRVAGIRFDVVCDVDNPLIGPRGAAAVYGPQKGATPDEVGELDAGLARWAHVVASATRQDHRNDPGAGAAGGIGFAAAAVLGARLHPGAQYVLDLVGFHGLLRTADLVVTGEGSLDAQTLHGKVPLGVLEAARTAHVPVVAVAGQCRLDDAQLDQAGFDAVFTLTDEGGSTAEALRAPGDLLRRIGVRIADRLVPGP